MRQFLSVILALLLIVPAVAQSTLDRCVSQWKYSVPKIIAGSSRGSGVYLGRGWVLSAKHVIRGEEGRPIACEFSNLTIPVTNYVRSYNSDQVLFKLQSHPPVPPVPLVRAPQTSVLVGAGYDNSRRLRFWDGRPGEVAYSGGINRSFFGSGGAIPGNSGGPVFCSTGLVGNLWGRDTNECVYSSNNATIDFIRRAAAQFPDLSPLLPDSQSQPIGLNAPMQNCPTCPPQAAPPVQSNPVQSQPVAPVQPQVQVPVNPGVCIGATVRPNFRPQVIVQGNSNFDIPVDIPITISVQVQPSITP